MLPETRAASRRGKTPPHAAVLSQVERILAHESFRDRTTLPEMLRFLVESGHAGRFDPPFTRDKPKPTGKLIVEEFYRYRFRTFMEDPPEDPALAGKKLIAQLRNRLRDYYGAHPDAKAHGRVRIDIPENRGTGYRPRITWVDGTQPPLPGDAAAAYSSLDPTIARAGGTHEPSSRGSSDLAALLNARLAFINDPEFGHEMERYFNLAMSHGIYCHNMRTTFKFSKILPRLFPNPEQVEALAENFIDLWIDETVEKICAPDKLRFAALLHLGSMKHHFNLPNTDFVWYIELPSDFEGKISDIFRIVAVHLDNSTIISNHEMDQKKLHIIRDDRMGFVFEIDITNIAARRRLRNLSYSFHTLKAKSHKCLTYGPRFPTRNLRIKVLSDSTSRINSWISEARLICAEPPESSGSSGSLEISATGWVLPEGGVTFSFDCRLPDRPDRP